MSQKTRKHALHTQPYSYEAQLRQEIAQILGEQLATLQEWNTRVCPDCFKDVELYPTCRIMGMAHLAPLYYALIPTEQEDGDMPLGIGPTAAEALADLLWTLRATRLMHDL
jgi:hypothetical protein